MRSFLLGLLVAPALFSAAAPSAGSAQAGKPLLSDTIRAVLERDGPDAARQRYEQIARNERDRYEFDMNGLAELATGYIRNGDMLRGQVVLDIATQAARYASGVPASSRQSASGRSIPARENRVPEDVRARKRGLAQLGPAREDLDRFAGVYGDPAAQSGRTVPHNYFVTASCEGHLRFGAMWGDVAPWSLKSMADAEFGQPRVEAGQAAALRVHFHLGGNGRATGLTHNMNEAWGAAAGQPATVRVERLGDLPPEWVPRCEAG